MMTNETKKAIADFEKSKDEIDAAAKFMAHALQAIHERLERVEEWISRQKNQPVK